MPTSGEQFVMIFFSVTDGNVVCLMLNFTQGALCTVGSSRYGQGTGEPIIY